MGGTLRLNPSIPDGWKDKDFPHNETSIGPPDEIGSPLSDESSRLLLWVLVEDLDVLGLTWPKPS